MRRWRGWMAIGLLLGLGTVALLVYGSPPASASLDDRARAVGLQLRCPVCQGESVADSDAAIAADMRSIIKRRLAQGQSPEQIKNYFVSKYGKWILLAPPSAGIGAVVWLGPPLLIVGGLGLVAAMVVGWKQEGDSRRDGSVLAASAPSGTYLDRIRAEVQAEDL